MRGDYGKAGVLQDACLSFCRQGSQDKGKGTHVEEKRCVAIAGRIGGGFFFV